MFFQVRAAAAVAIAVVVAAPSGNLLIYTHLGGFKLPVWQRAVGPARVLLVLNLPLQQDTPVCVCVCVCAHNSSAYLVVAKGSLP